MFDVFLCYNRADEAQIQAIAVQLKQQGVSYWLDTEQLLPGSHWLDVQERDMSRLRSVAIFYGRNGVGRWQTQEIAVFLKESVERKLRLIPVFLADAPSGMQLPMFLRMYQWVDFRLTNSDPMWQLICGIRGIRSSNKEIPKDKELPFEIETQNSAINESSVQPKAVDSISWSWLLCTLPYVFQGFVLHSSAIPLWEWVWFMAMAWTVAVAWNWTRFLIYIATAIMTAICVVPLIGVEAPSIFMFVFVSVNLGVAWTLGSEIAPVIAVIAATTVAVAMTKAMALVGILVGAMVGAGFINWVGTDLLVSFSRFQTFLILFSTAAAGLGFGWALRLVFN